MRGVDGRRDVGVHFFTRLLGKILVFGLVAGLVVALSACGNDGGEDRDILDGKARVPDDEGVATTLTFDKIVLDGERVYDVSPDLIAFSPYTLELEPMLRRRGQYVQIGVQGDTMIWMAGIGDALPVGDGLRAYYTGVLEEIGNNRAQFRDGTVLRTAGKVDAPELPQLVQVEIDAGKHEIVAILAASGPASSSTTSPTGEETEGSTGGQTEGPTSTGSPTSADTPSEETVP